MTFSAVWEGRAIVGGEASPGVELAQLGEGHARDFSGTVGCSCHLRIVHHDRYAVGCDLHVELDRVGAERNGLSK